jgi:hypothetical protein
LAVVAFFLRFSAFFGLLSPMTACSFLSARGLSIRG